MLYHGFKLKIYWVIIVLNLFSNLICKNEIYILINFGFKTTD